MITYDFIYLLNYYYFNYLNYSFTLFKINKKLKKKQKHCYKNEYQTQYTKIGSPYVVAAMNALAHKSNEYKVVGWEANGGFLVGTEFVAVNKFVLND